MENYNRYFEIMPQEIQNAVASVNLHETCLEIEASMPLTSAQSAQLEKALKFFLENIWADKNTRLNLNGVIPLSPEQENLLLKEIYDKVLLKIAGQLDQAGLNDSNVLFEAGGLKLTACRLYYGEHAGHETERIIYKKTEFARKSIFGRKKYYTIHLEADYPDRGRWGEYDCLSIRVKEEEVAEALTALNKAKKTGNFMFYLDILKRFRLRDFT